MCEFMYYMADMSGVGSLDARAGSPELDRPGALGKTFLGALAPLFARNARIDT